MGKKSIEIKYIEKKAFRQATFRSRAVGLLSKAHELGVLCGIKVSLVFQNNEGDVLSYMNNYDVLVLARDSFNQSLNKFKVETFLPESVTCDLRILIA